MSVRAPCSVGETTAIRECCCHGWHGVVCSGVWVGGVDSSTQRYHNASEGPYRMVESNRTETEVIVPTQPFITKIQEALLGSRGHLTIRQNMLSLVKKGVVVARAPQTRDAQIDRQLINFSSNTQFLLVF